MTPIRIGQWGKGDAKIVAWRDGSKVTFSFAKVYYDKRERMYKHSRVLYARELRQIGEAFLQAAEWAKKHVPTTEVIEFPMPKAESVVQSILSKMGIKQ